MATSKAPSKASKAEAPSEAPESPTKKPTKNICPGGVNKSLTVNTIKNNDASDGATTEDDSPSKMSYGEGQSPVRTMPKTF